MCHRKFGGSGFFGPWFWHSSSPSTEEQIAWLKYKKKKLERYLKQIDEEIEDLKGSE
ncbi:MAG: hypothetical protein ACFFGZ_08745 [Candidatus Thorarchaeota archaeon]